MNQQTELYQGHEQASAEWIIGKDAFGSQTYLFHATSPSFFAKIGEDEGSGLTSAFCYLMEDYRCLYDFVWLDVPPQSEEILNLLRLAEDAVLQASTDL